MHHDIPIWKLDLAVTFRVFGSMPISFSILLPSRACAIYCEGSIRNDFSSALVLSGLLAVEALSAFSRILCLKGTLIKVSISRLAGFLCFRQLSLDI